MKATTVAVLAATLALMADAAVAGDPVHLRRPNTRSPFSTAVRVGDTIYLAGQIGVRPDGTVPATIAEQTRQAMENLRTALTLADASFDDVVKCTVMLTDMAQYDAFNRVYLTYFKPDRLPARSAFAATGLAFGAQVEVDCIAHRPVVR